MQNGDKTLPSTILAGRGLLLKMLRLLLIRTIYFYQIFHTYTFFEIGKENDKAKKEKNSYAWNRTTTHASVAVGTRKRTRPLGHHVLYILEQFTYISFTCALQIKIARPLSPSVVSW